MDLISVHVPKAGGCTFARHLTSVYGADRVYKDYDDYPMNPLSLINNDREAWRVAADEQIRSIGPGFAVIHGHFVIEKYQGVYPEARRIAWVRHPASWVISLYYFWMHYPIIRTSMTNPLICRLQDENLPLLDFAEHPTVRDVISRVFLGGLPADEYDFLGVQEYLDDDVRDLCRMMGWPELEPSCENRSPGPAYAERVREHRDDPRVIDRLVSLNEGDMRLYETAVKLRSRRVESGPLESDRRNPRCVILSGNMGHRVDQDSRVA